MELDNSTKLIETTTTTMLKLPMKFLVTQSQCSAILIIGMIWTMMIHNGKRIPTEIHLATTTSTILTIIMVVTISTTWIFLAPTHMMTTTTTIFINHFPRILDLFDENDGLDNFHEDDDNYTNNGENVLWIENSEESAFIQQHQNEMEYIDTLLENHEQGTYNSN